MEGVLPGAAAIALHEIHLARQTSLQVPVGHIPVPGGIKLCSPGTFLVANYLIINNGSCQVNFTKPNTATIRYTNSERGSARMALRHLWAGSTCQSADRSPLRHARMPLRHLWVGSLCRRPARRPSSPRGDVTEVPVGRVAVPKTGQKTLFATPVCH